MEPSISRDESVVEFTLRAALAGIVFGIIFGAANAYLGLRVGLTVSTSIPIAVLIWLMIYPMMLKVDPSCLKDVGRKPKGLVLTLVVNWGIKPFTMLAIATFMLPLLVFVVR